MSGFRKGFLNKPENVKKTNQEEKQESGKMTEQEFEKTSRLAINKFFRKYIQETKIEGTPIDRMASRNYVLIEMVNDMTYSRVIREFADSFMYEILFDKLFNECALEILDEEEAKVGNKKYEAEIKSRKKYEQLCSEVVSDCVARVMLNARVFDEEKKTQIVEEIRRHNKAVLLQAELAKNTKNAYILENIALKIYWKTMKWKNLNEQPFLTEALKRVTQHQENFLKNVEMKKEYESLCHRVLKKCCSNVLERIKNSDATKLSIENYKRLLMDEIEKRKDAPLISRIIKNSEQTLYIYKELLSHYTNSIMEDHRKKISCSSKEKHNLEKKSHVTEKINSKEEFIKCYTEIFEEINGVTLSYHKLFGEGLMVVEESNAIVEEIMYNHKFFAKCKAAMEADESYKQLSKIIALRNSSIMTRKDVQKTIERNEKPKCHSKMDQLCHRVFKECYNSVFENLKKSNGTELKLEDYEKRLTEEIYQHKDINEITKFLDSLIENGLDSHSADKLCDNLAFFEYLIVEYSNKMMKEHKDSIKNTVVPKKLPKEETKDEKTNEKECGDDSTELSKKGEPEKLMKEKKDLEIKLRSAEEVKKKAELKIAEKLELEKENAKVLAENLRIEKEKLRKMNEEKKKSEKSAQELKKKLEKAEKTMAENLKKEKEHSKKLANDLKVERENKQFIAENLEKIRNENQNYADSLKWFRSELEKAEKLVENLKEKRENEKKEKEQLVSKISAMEEFQKINNKETEEWKAQIMKMFEKQAEELKITKQELKNMNQKNK